MSQLIDDVVGCFYQSIHTIQEDNWNYDRFSYLDKEVNRHFFIDQHSYYLKFFLRYSEKLNNVYDLLGDDESKNWLKNILLFRLLGHLHWRLPTNNEDHWRAREMSRNLILSESELEYTGLFGKLCKHLIKFENHSINIDCWWGNVAWTFLLKQYYFNRNNVEIRPELGDYIIDAGACFGDTALAFASSVGEIGRIFSFEIEPNNLDIACYNLMQNEDLAERIIISDYALSDTSESQMYLHGDGPGTLISDKPSEQPVNTITIDQLVGDGSIDRVDFIKMDIEGSELKALHGARETICKFRPKLAISIYHKPDDIFEIPAFVNSLNLGYQLYIDHYTIHNEETILYAKVPSI